MNQLQFNFHQENNPLSQGHYEACMYALANQERKVLSFLQEGNSITGDQAKELFGVRHLPRRIKTLRDMGFKIVSKVLPNRCFQYTLINHNHD